MFTFSSISMPSIVETSMTNALFKLKENLELSSSPYFYKKKGNFNQMSFSPEW